MAQLGNTIVNGILRANTGAFNSIKDSSGSSGAVNQVLGYDNGLLKWIDMGSYTHDYLPLSGGTLTGNLTLGDSTHTVNLVMGNNNNSYGLFPQANNSNTIGSSSLRWKYGYFQNLYGTDIYENGTALSAKYVPTTGGIMSGYLGTKFNNRAFYSFVGGGLYNCSSDAKTGILMISLPSNNTTYTMMKFTVSIYNHSNDTSSEYVIGGYNYSDNHWYSVFAYSLGRGIKSNLTVHFYDYDSTNGWRIGIGETDTTWSYPQVTIKDVEIGYSDAYTKNWHTGWGIDFTTTSPGTPNKNVSNPNHSETTGATTTRTLTAGATAWASNKQKINVTGITASNTVFVAPDPSSASVWGSCGVYCSNQEAGRLEFTCTTVPSSDITVNIWYMG